ncbi:MAG: PHP domain-containing protein [Lachnospiraceae bacterium]|nr:PHP domain-containing protein [Lachnospiraceae bacterium]
MSTADLHIHSMYSDGTMTIDQIARTAYERGVRLLAVSDHDMLDGARQLQKHVKQHEEYKDMCCIPAVEINTLDRGNNVHILGYHVDLEDVAFDAFITENRHKLDDVSIQMIRKMERDHETISLEEFQRFTYDRTKGGFEALHYLMEKGFTDSLKEGFRFFEIYDCPYSCVEFPDVPSAIEKIHKAGGIAVLAHPGVTIKERELEKFWQELYRFVDMGIEGIECYYPLHTDWITKYSLQVCAREGLYITAGSDCHGCYSGGEINAMKTPVQAVTLPHS